MWYYIPSSASAAEPADSTWELSELCRALERSATWNTKSLPAKSWQRVLRTVPYMTRRSGLICTPSTAARGLAAWRESLAVIPVSPSASPESGSEPQTQGTSGPRSRESSLSVSQLGASSKTWADTFGLATSTLFAQTSNALATGSRKASSRRRKSAPPTSGNASSSWPTATGQDSVASGSSQPRTATHHPGTTLTEKAGQWVTPQSASGGPNSQREGREGTGGPDLMEQAEHWPTPVANDDNKTPEGHLAKKPGSDSFRSRGGERKDEMGLDQQARWFTPSASEDAAGTVDGKMQQMLTHQAKHFRPSHLGQETQQPGDESSSSTPTSRRPSLDGMSSRTRSEVEALFRLSTRERTVVLGGWKKRKQWLQREGYDEEDFETAVPSSAGVLTTEKSRSFTRPAFRRQLNPNFVEWLMNWRPKWTSLAPLAFASPGTASSPPPPPSPFEPSGDNWDTPRASDGKGASSVRAANGGGN